MLQKLTPLERNVFILTAQTGGDFDKVANILHRHRGTIEQSFEGARKKLLVYHNGDPAKCWLSAVGISKKLGVDKHWVYRRIDRHKGLAIYARRGPGPGGLLYPPSLVGVLREELDHNNAFPRAGEYLTITQIRNLTSIGIKRCRRILYSMGLLPQTRRDKLGKPRPHWSPSVLRVLQDFVIPDAGELLTSTAIAKEIGVGRTRVSRKIASEGIMGELRRVSANSYKLCYTAEVLEKMRAHFGVEEGYESWLTEKQIANKLGISQQWTNTQIRKKKIPSESRLNEHHHPVKIYSPNVLGLLSTGRIQEAA